MPTKNIRYITTGGAGYVPPAPTEITLPIDALRQRLYNSVDPSEGYNIDNAIEQFVDNNDYMRNKRVRVDKTGMRYSGIMNMDVADAIWADYLNIPENKRRFKYRLKQSLYKPAISKERLQTYYKLPLTNDDINNIISGTNDLSIGKNTISGTTLAKYNLGTHTLGRGYDNKGEYRSYYDMWDLNPFTDNYGGTNIQKLNKLSDASFGIGKPVGIYDRIYLDDYYGVPSRGRGGVYLPEVTVYGKRRRLESRGKKSK